MDEIDFFIISTTQAGLLKSQHKMLKLLETPRTRNPERSGFENDFYPVIGLGQDGKVEIIYQSSALSGAHQLLIIPDSKPIEPGFVSFIQRNMARARKLYVLLHKGGKHGDQESALTAGLPDDLDKVKITKCHHTTSASQNPANALGDGLEMIATAILADPVNLKDFGDGLTYLKSRPHYYNVVLESLIFLHKSLKVLPLKPGTWNEAGFHTEMARLKKSERVKFAINWLETIVFKEDLSKYYKQLESIESEIVKYALPE